MTKLDGNIHALAVYATPQNYLDWKPQLCPQNRMAFRPRKIPIMRSAIGQLPPHQANLRSARALAPNDSAIHDAPRMAYRYWLRESHKRVETAQLSRYVEYFAMTNLTGCIRTLLFLSPHLAISQLNTNTTGFLRWSVPWPCRRHGGSRRPRPRGRVPGLIPGGDDEARELGDTVSSLGLFKHKNRNF